MKVAQTGDFLAIFDYITMFSDILLVSLLVSFRILGFKQTCGSIIIVSLIIRVHVQLHHLSLVSGIN